MRSYSSGGGAKISIAASAKKVDVENRISLRFYYRIADNLLRQADIYRAEKDIISLYIMLLRFSSLITETIPRHRDYQISCVQEKNTFGKKIYNAISELEILKPDVMRQINQTNVKPMNQINGWEGNDWPLTRKQEFTNSEITKKTQTFGHKLSSLQRPPMQQNTFYQAKLNEENFRKFSLNIPRPKEETLSRHSILGPNGLNGQWKPPKVEKKVEYPSNLDLTSIEIPFMQPPKQDQSKLLKDSDDPASTKSTPKPVISFHDQVLSLKTEDSSSVLSSGIAETPGMTDIIRQPSPPPVLADVQDLVSGTSCLEPVSNQVNSLEDELIRSESPLEVHISTNMMDVFMRLAKSNTSKNLETCGILAGSLKNRKFYLMALIIPKQESTANSCNATNEEEIFEYQDKKSLFPLGWIHTHPTQSCFMSSVDVHTHYSYQIMLPEAIAIVMAPTDASKKHGIFRLTTPGGMSVIRKCNHRGFHPHENPPDGGPIYHNCTDVYMNPKIKFDVVDFR
ncbi:STAM-binding protein [Zostera marina]|uniref:STAM-binding protein n=1 Tax=Zostera marina TaxID=29655 RepID=A0A0K9P8X5_ZOSMR|nr:STAM-binding protein [Zostera marina]